MRTTYLWFSLFLLFSLPPQLVRADESLSPTEREKALELLKDVKRLHSRNELVAMGNKILPLLWEECQKPTVTDAHLSQIFGVVAKIPGDREQFVELVAKHLQKKRIPTFGFFSALYLIKVTKSSKYAPDVAKRLCASDLLNIEVAETLVVIGTDKELLALEAWLKQDSRVETEYFKHRIWEETEKLRERLSTRNELAAMGGKVLPVLWVECQKPIVTDDELAWIFAVVAKIPGDREQFVELVAKHLQKKRIPTFGFFSALYLIKVTKSSKYAPDVAKRLCASDLLNIEVAETLVTIGTDKELLA